MQAGQRTVPVCSEGMFRRCSQFGHCISRFAGAFSNLRVILESLSIFPLPSSVPGVLSETVRQAMMPTSTTAKPDRAP